MTIKDTLVSLDKIYYLSLDEKALSDAQGKLEKIFNGALADDENRKNAKGLNMRIGIKKIALTSVRRNLSINKEELLSSLEEIEKSAKDESFLKTAILASNVKTLVYKLSDIYFLCNNIAKTYLPNEKGEILADEKTLIKAKDSYTELQAQLDKLPSEAEIFGQVRFLSIKEEISELISELINETEILKDRVVKRSLDEALKTCFYSVPQEWNDYTISAGISGENENNLTVVVTPFKDEFSYLINSISKKSGKRPVYITIKESTFSRYDERDIEKLVTYFKSSGDYFAVTGLSNYHSANKGEIINAFYRLAHKNEHIKVFLHDYTGSHALWQETEKALSGVYDTYYMYLTMPSYKETIDLLDSFGIDAQDGEFVKNSCAFMGYIGLNRVAISLASFDDNWKKIAYKISSSNHSLTEGYFRDLPSQAQLLDSGWGEHHAYANKIELEPKRAFSFDYDDKKLLNPNKIKQIVEMENITLQEKCGLATRYCLLLGDDYTSWQELSSKEKLERITLATKTVSRLLDVQYDPIVELPDEIEGKAGGYCYGGGKKIVYSLKSASNYEWMADAICHEVYHSFQHTAINNGFRLWHRTELMVSPYRIEEWEKAQSSYIDINENAKHYKLQAFEVDARVFAKETTVGANDKWSLL